MPIAACDECVANDHWAETFLSQIVQCVEVPEALRHLGSFHHKVSAVEPVLTEVVPVGTFGLSDLVLVVGEAEVDAAAVQVDRFAVEGTINHGRAL